MRISDWSSDVCSSDLGTEGGKARQGAGNGDTDGHGLQEAPAGARIAIVPSGAATVPQSAGRLLEPAGRAPRFPGHRRGLRWSTGSRSRWGAAAMRLDGQTSGIQSLMGLALAVLGLNE